MNSELTERLFALAHDVAQDLAAFNVQRGRDHALRSYNDYRRHCRLSTAASFNDFRAEIRDDDVRRKLRDVYRHPGMFRHRRNRSWNAYLQLRRLWGLSVFGPLQLLQLAVSFRWALWATYSASPDIFAKYKGRRKEE